MRLTLAAAGLTLYMTQGDVRGLWVSAWEGALHILVQFNDEIADEEDELARRGRMRRAKSMAHAVAHAPPPSEFDYAEAPFDKQKYGGYVGLNMHAYIIFDARIATRVQTWLGGMSTSGQYVSCRV